MTPAEVPVKQSASHPEPAGEILVVEDDQPVASALVRILEHAGFPAIAFTHGLKALAHAQSHPPIAAILDIHLPDINGLELTRRLRDLLGPDTPLVVLSGDTSMTTLNNLSDSGATHFLAKPVQGRALIEHLRQWLGA